MNNKLRLAVTTLALGTALYMGISTIPSARTPLAAMNAAADVVQSEAASSATAANAATPLPLDELGKQIQSWIEGLAGLPGFDAWQSATWKPYPLGPGTHGWVVLVNHDKTEVGYLVVSATPEGSWVMTEYGTGSSPLFSLNTLYRTLVQLELIQALSDSFRFLENSPLVVDRLYHSPLHAVWQVNPSAIGSDRILYLDALTGEQLPLDNDPFRSLLPVKQDGLYPSTQTIQADQAMELQSFDPFHNTSWIRGKHLQIEAFSDLQNQLRSSPKVTYVGDLYDKRVLAPFAVTGYTTWHNSGSPFIRLDQDGTRYIPFRELFENGFFFP